MEDLGHVAQPQSQPGLEAFDGLQIARRDEALAKTARGVVVRAVRFVDAIPRTPAAKILRRVLVEDERQAV